MDEPEVFSSRVGVFFRAPEVANIEAIPLVDEATGHRQEDVLVQTAGIPFQKLILLHERFAALEKPEHNLRPEKVVDRAKAPQGPGEQLEICVL